jgi:hypothetical protein
MHMDALRAIAGIEIFPVISLLLFVAVFTVVLVWTLRLDRAHVAAAAHLPLDGPTRSDAAPDTTAPATRSDR